MIKMKTEWDYTNLAEAYLHRPSYAADAISQMLKISDIHAGDSVCDVGAGAAHLTLELAKAGMNVYAVEPNDAMRANGVKRTAEFPNVTWSAGVGEHTGMPDGKFRLVTFGSSFNVCDRQQTLKETARILAPGGYFACMWNHRDLNDPLQQEIEAVIKSNIPDYSYGTRREDQTAIIDESGLFKEVQFISGQVNHNLPAQQFIEGWKSHGTVFRQSPDIFDKIIAEIQSVVEAKHQDNIIVPYTTRIWLAQTKR